MPRHRPRRAKSRSGGPEAAALTRPRAPIVGSAAIGSIRDIARDHGVFRRSHGRVDNPGDDTPKAIVANPRHTALPKRKRRQTAEAMVLQPSETRQRPDLLRSGPTADREPPA